MEVILRIPSAGRINPNEYTYVDNYNFLVSSDVEIGLAGCDNCQLYYLCTTSNDTIIACTLDFWSYYIINKKNVF